MGRFENPLWVALGAVVVVAVGACGGAQTAVDNGGSRVTLPPLDAAPMLLAYGRSRPTPLARPASDVDALEATRRAARSPDQKRVLAHDLVIVHAYAAEEATSEEERAAGWANVAEHARVALQGNRDTARVRNVAFIQLWRAYRLGEPDALRLADTFVSTYREHADDTLIASLVRGELALAAGEWAKARDGFRYVLGNESHPLYAYAMVRTGEAFRGEGAESDARQSFEVASRLGCEPSASAETAAMARRAWEELGSPVREGAPAERPWCAPRAARGNGLDLR